MIRTLSLRAAGMVSASLSEHPMSLSFFEKHLIGVWVIIRQQRQYEIAR